MVARLFNINHAMKTPLCLSLLEHIRFNNSKQTIALELTKRNADFTIKSYIIIISVGKRQKFEGFAGP